jgi:hypothetical protein
VLDLARVKAWSFARPVTKNSKMSFTDCGAAYLRQAADYYFILETKTNVVVAAFPTFFFKPGQK